MADKEEQKRTQRRRVIHEIIQTERSYLDDLKHLKKVFMEPLIESGLLPTEVIAKIFLNLDQLIGVHQKILNSVEEGTPPATVLGQQASSLKCYSVYCDSCDAGMELWKTALEKDKKLKAWEAGRQALSEGLRMQDYLIKPVQRLCKYPLLLRSLLECLTPDTEEYKGVSDSFASINSVLQNINTLKDVQENFNVLKNYSARLVDYPDTIIKGGRKFLREGKFGYCKGKASNHLNFTPTSATQGVFIVFSDILVLCHPKKEKLLVQCVMNLHLTLVTDTFQEHPHHTTTVFIESPEDKDIVRMIFFQNPTDKQLWFQFLRATTKEAKTKTFRKVSVPTIPSPALRKETSTEEDVSSVYMSTMSENPTQTDPNTATSEAEEASSFVLSVVDPPPQPSSPRSQATLLCNAVANNDIEAVKSILSCEKPEEFVNILVQGKNALHMASAQGSAMIVLELCNTTGIEVNFVIPGVGTPLHGAIYYEKLDCAAILLVAGANPTIPNTQGINPLQTARGKAVYLFSLFQNTGMYGLLQEYPIAQRLKTLRLSQSSPAKVVTSSISPRESPKERTEREEIIYQNKIRSPSTPQLSSQVRRRDEVSKSSPEMVHSYQQQVNKAMNRNSDSNPIQKTPEELLKIISLLKGRLESTTQELNSLRSENQRLKQNNEDLVQTIFSMTHDRVYQAIEFSTFVEENHPNET